MDNVIEFPRPEEKVIAPPSTACPMTLFVHVRCATLIVHLADTRACAVRGERVGRS